MLLVLAQSFTSTDKLTQGQNSSRAPHCLTLDKAVSIESSDERFFYCLKVQRLTAFCCCKSFTLRHGLFAISFLEILTGLLAMISLILFEDAPNIYHVALRIVQAQGIVMGALCASAAKTLNLETAVPVYHWKMWEPFILGVLQVIDTVFVMTEMKNITGVEVFLWGTLGTSILCVVRVLYGVYVSYILYSFIHLLRKGGQALVRYGPNVLSTMERIRTHAEVMDMYPEEGGDIEMTETTVRNIETN